MVTADHGPAVSGAHNTIVAARAGKDLVSSLTSGLLTIGDRFGGALDGAARMFTQAYDENMIPMEFVNSMRKQHKLIMGIGHRIKSVSICLFVCLFVCRLTVCGNSFGGVYFSTTHSFASVYVCVCVCS